MASPRLCQRIRSEIETRHDTEVIPSAAESPEEIWCCGVRDLGYGAVGEDHFVVNDVVKCPAVSPADKTYSSFHQYQFPKLSFMGR